MGGISGGGCGASVGNLAMGQQPPVDAGHLGGCCADPSGLLALDHQHPSVVGNGGNSEKLRLGSRRQNEAQDENTRLGSRRKKKKRMLPMQLLATSCKMTDLNQGLV